MSAVTLLDVPGKTVEQIEQGIEVAPGARLQQRHGEGLAYLRRRTMDCHRGTPRGMGEEGGWAVEIVVDPRAP